MVITKFSTSNDDFYKDVANNLKEFYKKSWDFEEEESEKEESEEEIDESYQDDTAMANDLVLQNLFESCEILKSLGKEDVCEKIMDVVKELLNNDDEKLEFFEQKTLDFSTDDMTEEEMVREVKALLNEAADLILETDTFFGKSKKEYAASVNTLKDIVGELGENVVLEVNDSDEIEEDVQEDIEETEDEEAYKRMMEKHDSYAKY